MTNPSRRGVHKGQRKAAILSERQRPKGTSTTLAILAIVYLFYQGGFIMNSIKGSQTIPTFVDLKNALIKVKTLRFFNLKVGLGM